MLRELGFNKSAFVPMSAYRAGAKAGIGAAGKAIGSIAGKANAFIDKGLTKATNPIMKGRLANASQGFASKGYKSRKGVAGALRSSQKDMVDTIKGVGAVGAIGGVGIAGGTAVHKSIFHKNASSVGGIGGTTGFNVPALVATGNAALKELGRPVHTDNHADVPSPATEDATYLGYFAKDKSNTDKKIGHVGTSPCLGAMGFLHKESA
jgi:hypothetical protein